ncbi:MAG: S8 family serine peptidase [Bacteroidetes bacterium]|nr:S8 family serine peptidase [Bacteroidota bacterium]
MLGPFIFHALGISLAVLAFLVFGRGIVRKAKGKGFNPLPAFVLILVAVAFQLIFGGSAMTGKLAGLLVDFGIGMMIASLYLSIRKERAKLFWVPGAMALGLGGVMSIFSFCMTAFNHDIKSSQTTTEILVELGPDDHLEEIKDILDKYNAVAEKAFPEVDLSEDEDLAQYYLIFVDSSMKDPLTLELNNDPENVDQWAFNNPVSLIEPFAGNETMRPPTQFLADDPFLNQQWFADKLDYNSVYEFLKSHKPKKKVKVAIVDTGVDKDHEDISSVYTKSGGDGDYDKHSHGTHCGGLAGAATNNGKGVGSLNWDGDFITLSGYPALDDQGRGTDRRVANAIINAAEGGADVISMSLGGFSPFGAPKAQVDAIKYARKKGAIVVVAAGNSNDDARRYSPANIDGVIVVSAIDENLNKASFSNTNTKLKMPIAAPGVNILSSVPGSEYQSYNGTSMATPIVSGLIGIMKSYNPSLTAEEVHKILVNTGKQVKDSDRVGKVINPRAAIEAIH